MNEFGQLLKDLRKEHKVTQRKLAELIGIDFTYISKIENGSMEPPAEDKIIKIAEVFNKDPNELLIAAKKVPTDFHKVIIENKNVPVFLRSASKLTKKQWDHINKIINEGDHE